MCESAQLVQTHSLVCVLFLYHSIPRTFLPFRWDTFSSAISVSLSVSVCIILIFFSFVNVFAFLWTSFAYTFFFHLLFFRIHINIAVDFVLWLISVSCTLCIRCWLLCVCLLLLCVFSVLLALSIHPILLPLACWKHTVYVLGAPANTRQLVCF